MKIIWKKSWAFIWRALVFLALGSATLIIFFPSIMTRYFQFYANRLYLEPYDLRISYTGFEGDVFDLFTFQQIVIEARDGRFAVSLENTGLDIDFVRLLKRDLSFDEVAIEKLVVRLPQAGGHSPWPAVQVADLPWITVGNLTLRDGLIIQGDQRSWLRLNGAVDINGVLNLGNMDLELSNSLLEDTLQFRAELITVDDEHINIQNGLLSYLDYTVNTTGQLERAEPLNIAVDIESEQLPPGIDLPPWLTAGSTYGQVRGTADSLIARLYLDLNWRGHALDSALVDISLIDEKVGLSYALIARGAQRVELRGAVDMSGAANVEAQFTGFNLIDFFPNAPAIVVNGSAGVLARWESGSLDSLQLKLNLDSLEYQGVSLAEVSGLVNMEDNRWIVGDSTSIVFAGSQFKVRGSFDQVTEQIDLELYLQTDTLASLLAAVGLPIIQGQAHGRLWGNGLWRDPALTGAVMLSDVRYKSITVGQSFIQFVFDKAFSSVRGRLMASSGDLDFAGLRAEGGEAEFIFQGDSVQASSIRLYQGFDKLDTRGYLSLSGTPGLFLDTLTVIRNSEFLSVPPVMLALDGTGAKLQPVNVQVAGGEFALAGTWVDGRNYNMHISSSRRIDIERLYRFLGRPPGAMGNVDLTIAATNKLGRLRVDGTATARDGILGNVPFNRFRSEFLLAGNRLGFKTLDWATPEGEAVVTGDITYLYDPSSNTGLGRADSLQFTGQVSNYEFHDLQAWMPWRYATAGLVSGSFSVTGTVTDPVYVADLSFDNPKFDLITGERLSGTLRYEKQRLHFENLKMVTRSGQYTGDGSLPMDINPGTPRSEVLVAGDLDMDLRGSTSQLDWFTPYFAIVDSALGEYELDLSLSGSWWDIRRDGSLKVKNGQIELFVIENPIAQIEGDAVIVDNLLIINRLEGKTPRDPSGQLFQRLTGNSSKRKPGKIRSDDRSYLQLAGTMDMTEFFHPDFNLRLEGENVYFATALKEIEGVGAASFTVTGKDTINLRGDFIPEPGGLLFAMDFTTDEAYLVPVPDEGTLIVYNIRVPFHTGATVRNSEVDAEVEGEITLTAVGAEEFRNAGTVEIIQGESYYEGQIIDNLRGTIVFEPSEFNPQFTIEGVTEIPYEQRMEEVTLLFTGTLEEPILTFNTDLPLTDSDLLSLLTIGGQTISESDPTSKATSTIGKMLLRESEQYARRVSGLDRFKIQTGGLGGSENGEGLKINVGKRISRKLYIGLDADPTLGFYQYGYHVSYRLSPTMSLEGSLAPGQYQVNYRLKYRY
ncbi:MAG: translocation/assembly module TamB domain-containing protein [Candidatus Marinimicrobia bacterium]|nr:translocation/assembly module TamB domain-containing protein [Candidatus Neomarinimicrobiota bacterium]